MGIEFDHIRINSGMVIFRCPNEIFSLYLFTFLKSKQMQVELNNYLSGSAQPQLPIKDIVKIPFIIPDIDTMTKFSIILKIIQQNIDVNENLNRKLLLLKNILLSKLATMKN